MLIARRHHGNVSQSTKFIVMKSNKKLHVFLSKVRVTTKSSRYSKVGVKLFASSLQRDAVKTNNYV